MTSQSPTIGKLAEALVKAQADFGPLRKGKANPFFKSRYADLAAVIDVIREPFAENGLAFIQAPGFAPATAAGGDPLTLIHTSILHVSGEWISSAYPVLAKRGKDGPPGPQEMGSAVTYARRYALQAMVGLAAEDDDGNRAAGKAKREIDRAENDAAFEEGERNLAAMGREDDPLREPRPAPAAKKPAVLKRPEDTVIPDSEIRRLWAELKKAGLDELALRDRMGRDGLTSTRKLTYAQHADLMAWIRAAAAGPADPAPAGPTAGPRVDDTVPL